MTLIPRNFCRIRQVVCKRWKLILVAGLLAGILSPLLIDGYISASTRSRCVVDVSKIRERPVALVLGTSREFSGRMNAFYVTRISAAAELFKAGKVRGILVSGDNGSRYYDEPTDMRDDLVEAGVPAEFITLDYAGFRTRDSIIRAKEVFGVKELIVVTQRFHAERALFIADREGIDATAFIAADPVSRASNTKVRMREVLARTLAVVDCVIGKDPRFLGAAETVNLASR